MKQIKTVCLWFLSALGIFFGLSGIGDAHSGLVDAASVGTAVGELRDAAQ